MIIYWIKYKIKKPGIHALKLLAIIGGNEMARDRIEFVVGNDYGELKKYINDWLTKSENIRVRKIELFRPTGSNENRLMCMIWYESIGINE